MIVNKEREIQIIIKFVGKFIILVKVIVIMFSKKKVELKEKLIFEGYQIFFIFIEVGFYKVEVIYGGSLVFKFLFIVDVLFDFVSKVKVYGLGFKGGNVNFLVEFIIDFRVVIFLGEFGVIIEGFKEVKIKIKQNFDGIVGVIYYFEVLGEYKINVIYVNVYIKDLLFKVKILLEDVVNKVKCYGEGLIIGFVMQLVIFIVDIREVFKFEKKIDVKVKGLGYVKVEMKKKLDIIIEVIYYFIKLGDYIIDVIYDGKQVKDSLFKVIIKLEDVVSKVKVYGLGFIGGNVNVVVIFIVDIKEVFVFKQNVDV